MVPMQYQRMGLKPCVRIGDCLRPWLLIILMYMAKESMPPKPQTPFERFTEAAKHIVNLPKSETDKIKAKVPYKPAKRRTRR